MQQRTLSSGKHIAGFLKILMLAVLLCVIPGLKVNAQEMLRGLSVNPEILKLNNTHTPQPVLKSQKKGMAITAGDTLTLPFTDDFSTASIYPDSTLWQDRTVLINSKYSIGPPTPGVATFDAINKSGMPYDSITGRYFYADTLTSQPINLKAAGSNIFLSFFYQPQGAGNALATGDSLMLEYFNADSTDSTGWTKIWSVPGRALQPFKEVILPVNNPIFLKSGFRFRFRNKDFFYEADTLNQNRVGLWHIDNVRLDKNRNANDSLKLYIKLPFLDDFSTTTVYPNDKLWIDHYAYINSTFALNPLSIGVATLDAIDENGLIYGRATSTPFDADHLTSKPLEFSSPARSDIFLSFFYQPQGIGDAPETGDSLILDFYDPSLADSIAWVKMWAVPGDSVYPFKQQLIQVTPEFQQKGFRFRFRNLASLSSSSDDPGRNGDVDHWHLDYVRLDAGRNANDTIIADVACVKPMSSLLQTYQAMPWQHFILAFNQEIKPKIGLSLQNNDAVKHFVDKSFIIKDLYGSNIENILASTENLASHTFLNYQTDLVNPFITNSTDSALFEVKGFIGYDTLTSKVWRNNDTVRFLQIFNNYFALDDGSSEMGYGISGLGAQDAKVAYQFKAYQADTLTAISIFFNPTENNISTTNDFFFQLAVWGDKNGQPGSLLYEKNGLDYKPIKLNQFYPYKLDAGLVVSGTFYVGWVQTSTNFLNVGFDLNNNSQSKLFTNIDGTWHNSAFNGSLMVRPIFRTKPTMVGIPEVVAPGKFNIYPNPAQGYINIDTGLPSNDHLVVSVYDITGKLILQANLQGSTLDVGSLSGGLYIVKLSGKNTNTQPVKLLIQR